MAKSPIVAWGTWGLRGTTVTAKLATQNQFPVNEGVLIVKVIPGAPADQAGLKVGEIIVQIDNTKITDISELNNYVLSKSPGTEVSLEVYQGNQLQTVKVTLGTLPLSS